MIARIIPLIRLPSHLDYFDYAIPTSLRADISIGQIVRIPFRKKMIHGVIIDIQKNTQSEALKEIQKIIISEPAFTSFQKELLSWFSDFYFVSRATVSRMMLLPPRTRKQKEDVQPQEYFSEYQEKKIRLSQRSIRALSDIMTRIENIKKPILFHCALEHEKIMFYAKCAQNTLKQKKQFLLICPTIPEALHIARMLAPYFSSPITCLHGNIRISDLRHALEEIQRKRIHIIIGTRMALFHAIPNLDTIIIDQSERMEHKQYDMHPRYHISTVACALAKRMPIRVILQSHAPRIEDMYAGEKGELEYVFLDAPISSTPLIHLTQEEYIPHAPLISETLKNNIIECLHERKNVFLFLNKKGLSSYAMCQTCHTIFSCPTCGRHRPYSTKTRYLSCTFCNTHNPIPSVCHVCKGSAFVFPGMGSEKIISSCKKLFPGVSVYEINKDTPHAIPTSPCIIIGTSFIPLSHPELFSHFGLVAILLADPSASLTDFRSHEIQWQILSRILMLAHTEKSSIAIQAFQKENPFISTLCRLDWKSFSDVQLNQRKEFGWPPYSRLITLLYRLQKTKNDSTAIKNLYETLSNTCKKYARVSILPKRTAREQDRIHLTIDSSYTLCKSLSEQVSQELKKLPPGWLVDIDPILL